MKGKPAAVTPLNQVLLNTRLPALDGIRALAVFTVIFYHAGIDAVPGDLGVTAFFVLSGFLITTLLLREHALSGGINFRAFYIRRTLRIFPAYYALVAFTFVVDSHLGVRWPQGRLLAAITYTLNYHNALLGHDGPVPHAWSLAVEEQFYLVWPLVFVLLVGCGRVRTGLVAAILAALASRCILLGYAPIQYLYNAFETRLDSLAIGCLMAVLCQSATFVRHGEKIAKPWAPVLVLAMLLVSRTAIGMEYHFTFGFTVDSLLVAVLILQLMQLSSVSGWKWIEHPVIRWLGVISYPLYLWHIWGIAIGEDLGGSIVTEIGVSIALAATSYYVVERFFLKLKTQVGAGQLARAGSTGLTGNI